MAANFWLRQSHLYAARAALRPTARSVLLVFLHGFWRLLHGVVVGEQFHGCSRFYTDFADAWIYGYSGRRDFR
ncbi:hypothetical protein KCP75_11940 [Salmonella enterica subsp. enterica]|nr:hypothetical protein KCP75_11940 [Salmonella enterica subsp. enterica]